MRSSNSHLTRGVASFLVLLGLTSSPQAEEPDKKIDPREQLRKLLPGRLAILPVVNVSLQPAGAGRGELEATLNFSGITVDDLLKQLKVETPFPIAGRVSLNAKLKIPLETANDTKTYRLEGDVEFPRLQLGDLNLSLVKARLRLAMGVLYLDDVHAFAPLATEKDILLPSPAASVLIGPGYTAAMPGNKLRGNARAQLDPAGPVDLELFVEEVDILGLTRRWTDFPVKIEGLVSGSVKAKIDPTPKEGPTFEGQIDLTSPAMRIEGVLAEKVKGHVEYREGKGNFRVEGETGQGGRFSIDGKITPSAPPAGPVGLEGTIRLERIQLGQLAAQLFPPARQWRGLRGRLNLEFDFRTDSLDARPTGRGRLSLFGVSWNEAELVRRFQTDLILAGNFLRLTNFRGETFGGRLAGLVGINIVDPDRSFFALSLTGIEASTFIAMLTEFLSPESRYSIRRPEEVQDRMGMVSGPLEINVRGNGGREIRGSGSIVLGSGVVGGLEVGEWRLPFHFSHSVQYGSGQATFHEGIAQLSTGRAQGEIRVHWGDTVRLDGSYRFFDVELRSLVRRTSSLNRIATGRLSGRLSLNSTNLRSVEDLNGSFTAALRQTQGLQLPVLHELTPFLLPGQSTAVFNTGDIRAQISRGVVRLDRFTLDSPLVALIVEGNLELNGRLNLQATARTTTLPLNENLLNLAGVSVPATGAIPLTAIVRVSTLLSNRVLHFRITGTFDRPIVRLEPIRILTEEAVRFFLLGSDVSPFR